MMNTTGEIRTADSAPVVVSSGYVWYSPADWWRFLKRWPILPVLVLVAVVLGAVFAKQISPHEPDKGNLRARDIPPLWFEGSSTEHPLGTNNLGQDMLVRVLEGARVSLVVASVAVLFGLFLGTITGMLAGYFGGLLDELLMRLVDLWSSLPLLMIAIIWAVSIQPSLWSVTLLLSIFSWSSGTRNIRGEILSLKNRDFVIAARTMGASDLRILWSHLFPQIVHIVIVVTTLRTGALIVAESGLSFLGVGLPASVPSWGLLITQGRAFLTTTNWWMSIVPGLFLFLTVMSFNFLGDWAPRPPRPAPTPDRLSWHWRRLRPTESVVSAIIDLHAIP